MGSIHLSIPLFRDQGTSIGLKHGRDAAIGFFGEVTYIANAIVLHRGLFTCLVFNTVTHTKKMVTWHSSGRCLYWEPVITCQIPTGARFKWFKYDGTRFLKRSTSWHSKNLKFLNKPHKFTHPKSESKKLCRESEDPCFFSHVRSYSKLQQDLEWHHHISYFHTKTSQQMGWRVICHFFNTTMQRGHDMNLHLQDATNYKYWRNASSWDWLLIIIFPCCLLAGSMQTKLRYMFFLSAQHLVLVTPLKINMKHNSLEVCLEDHVPFYLNGWWVPVGSFRRENLPGCFYFILGPHLWHAQPFSLKYFLIQKKSTKQLHLPTKKIGICSE